MDQTQTLGMHTHTGPADDRVASLVVFAAPGRAGRGTVWPLSETLLFGRHELATQALEDGRMSGRHAEIARKGDDWVIRDLNSRNGTSVGGRLLTQPTVLKHGDTIRMGASVLLFAWLPPDTGNDDLGMAGLSASMHDARHLLRAVATHPHTVLLLGETGTGKEVAAKAVHRASGRRGPFVALNCGALSASMLESELFGHRKGAFTGAITDSPGVFRAANGGTLFLDEIGEMPVDLQTRLLRVLESRTVRPVGGNHEIPVDVRVVAATNRDPAERVRAGQMRADLYARLAQWTQRLPPLRERREDLATLVTVLLTRMGAAERRLAPDLALALALHAWPLNVRGLHNVLSVAIVASPGPVLQLSEPVQQALTAASALMAEPSSVSAPQASPTTQASPDVEALRDALEAHGGSVAPAARALGLSRQQLYRLASKLGVDLSAYRS